MDPYRVLELHPGASREDVKAAYRRHALQHHPDLHVNSTPELRRSAEAAFKRATAAYEAITKNERGGPSAASSSYSAHRRPGSSPFSDKYYRSAYESSYSHTYNYTRQRRPSAAPFSVRFVSAVVGNWRAFTSSGSAAVTAALGGLFLGGILFLEPLFTSAWERHNEGKLFRHVEGELIERRRAAAAAAMAARVARERREEEARQAAERLGPGVIAEPVPEAVPRPPKKKKPPPPSINES